MDKYLNNSNERKITEVVLHLGDFDSAVGSGEIKIKGELINELWCVNEHTTTTYYKPFGGLVHLVSVDTFCISLLKRKIKDDFLRKFEGKKIKSASIVYSDGTGELYFLVDINRFLKNCTTKSYNNSTVVRVGVEAIDIIVEVNKVDKLDIKYDGELDLHCGKEVK